AARHLHLAMVVGQRRRRDHRARQTARGRGRHLAAQPGPGLHHRDDEQAARRHHRRQSAGRLAAQRPRDRRLVQDRADRQPRPAGRGRGLREADPDRVGRPAQAAGPLDCAPDAGLPHDDAVHVAPGDGQGRRHQGAQDLGRVQRARDGDEGRRHHSGRQWRHPLGRRHEARDRARRHQRRVLSRRADEARRQGAEERRHARGLRPASPVRQLDGSQHCRPALLGEPAEVPQGRDGHADDGRLGPGRDQEPRRQARGRADHLGAAERRQAVLRAQRRFDDLLEAQGAGPDGWPAAARQADDAEGRAGAVLADHRLDPGPHRRRPVGRGVVGRPARGRPGAERVVQEQARAAQPRPQHGAAQPDLVGHDRRAHRVRPQRQGDARAGRAAAGGRGGYRARMRRRLADFLPLLVIWLPLLISVAHVVGFTAWTTWLSFTPSDLLPEYDWAGLRSYRAVLRTENTEIAYANLLVYGVGYVGLTMIIGFVLAVLIDQRIRAENLLRTIYLYPLAVSFVVTGTVWSWLFNPGQGIQKFVNSLGWTSFRFDWIIDRDFALYTIIIAAVWHGVGFAMALFLAGLRSIDPDLHKAAQIDGAGPFRFYLRIAAPGVAPIAISVLVILLQYAIKTFDLVRLDR